MYFVAKLRGCANLAKRFPIHDGFISRCDRGEVPPHDCAIPVLLESMVSQERMLHGEPIEARLEEILLSGKEY
ncbi:hypothetical protein TNCV_550171 [Trichonephila clavipes]|nr:hypothetical protein TNCV_550171 [Trichonephila clavipes]